MIETYEITDSALEEVNGGFVCGGLCLGLAAFAAGALFGAGIAVGKNSN